MGDLLSDKLEHLYNSLPIKYGQQIRQVVWMARQLEGENCDLRDELAEALLRNTNEHQQTRKATKPST